MDTVFGREEILDILKKRLGGFKNGYRQNIALIGSPLIGKTSLLATLPQDARALSMIPVYLQLENRLPSEVIGAFFEQALSGFLKEHGVEINGDINYLINKSQPFLPKSAAKINSIKHALEKNKHPAALLELFELAGIFCEEANKQCLIILDEFQNLSYLGGEEIFAELAKKIVIQKNTMFVLSSSAAARSKEILSHGLSLLFGNFEVLEITPYNTALANRFIEEKLGNLKLNQTHKSFLVDFTGGLPFYLDEFSRELTLSSGAIGAGSVTEDIFIKSFETLLWRQWGVINQKFANFLENMPRDREGRSHINIISSIINGQNKIRQIASFLNIKENLIQQKTLSLCEAGIITKNGDFIYASDKVFAFWFKSVYLRKIMPHYIYSQEPFLGFRQDLLSQINSFSSYLSKPIAERILDLLKMFKDESVNIERKKIMLPSFKNAGFIKLQGGNFDAMLYGKSQSELWMVAIKNGVLREDDINQFLSECKKHGQLRSQRKIIVTLSNIDTNTKLKALQEKIITWQATELNLLLNLYNKPAVFV